MTLNGDQDKLIVAKWHHMATKIWVKIGSDNGLLPDGTKPLPEQTLIYYQWGPERNSIRDTTAINH